jgi:hypothetical protein
MSSSGGPNEPKWKILYQAAVLELDIGALQHRIEAAKAAIHSRIAEVDRSQVSGEASQLQDALYMLDVLLRINRLKE